MAPSMLHGIREPEMEAASFFLYVCHWVFMSWLLAVVSSELHSSDRIRATGEKGPATELELGTYALRSRIPCNMLGAAEPATTTPHAVPASRRGS